MIKCRLTITIGILIPFILSCKFQPSSKEKVNNKDSKIVLLKEENKQGEISPEIEDIKKEDIKSENIKVDIKVMMNTDTPKDEFLNLEWYGIFVKNKSSEIRKVSIDIAKFHDLIFDSELPEDSEEVTGRELIILGNEKPLFLVSGIKGIQERIIPAVKIKEQQILENYKSDFEYTTVMAFIKPAEELNVSYNKDSIKFTADGNPENFKKDNIILDTPYRLFVSSKSRETQLISEVNDFQLESHIYGFTWFGDLDADGKIDMLMSISNHYVIRSHTLFLSSYASEGETFKDVVTYGYSID